MPSLSIKSLFARRRNDKRDTLARGTNARSDKCQYQLRFHEEINSIARFSRQSQWLFNSTTTLDFPPKRPIVFRVNVRWRLAEAAGASLLDSGEKIPVRCAIGDMLGLSMYIFIEFPPPPPPHTMKSPEYIDVTGDLTIVIVLTNGPLLEVFRVCRGNKCSPCTTHSPDFAPSDVHLSQPLQNSRRPPRRPGSEAVDGPFLGTERVIFNLNRVKNTPANSPVVEIELRLFSLKTAL
ncbi:hypothetical protein EVAR_29119_1 [Eumeta japonica]|uniref:Uncharacterized protein n=1 Tax=Eumeta variegata TaxID=151549 RepID=A0A4C1VP00_EUMVA|nr:hypothetical protein EVAR_29119_1 [Eumeta japonica]